MGFITNGGGSGGSISGVTVTGTATVGQVPVATSGTAGTWSTAPYQAFSSTVVGSATTVVDTGAGGIPGGFHVLLILIQAVDVGGGGNPTLTFNNDSAANYDEQGSFVNNGATSFLGNFAQTSCNIYVNSATTGTSVEIIVPNYTGTVMNKTFSKRIVRGNTATTTMYTINASGEYRSTSAITRFACTSNGTNWLAGSTFQAYLF